MAQNWVEKRVQIMVAREDAGTIEGREGVNSGGSLCVWSPTDRTVTE